MAASSTNSWLHTSLLSPSSQQSAQHSLYTTDLQPSSQLVQQHPVSLGQQGHHIPCPPCDSFCQPLLSSLSPVFQHGSDGNQLQEYNGAIGGSCSGRVIGENGAQVCARKVHKADREKLRRDRLNEQFSELASVLDPERPKNDKATILGDSVQAVKELRAEVKRLRTEHASLLDESKDLTQEKSELREEKASLKNETEQLQAQLQQRLRLIMPPWINMDPSLMMGAPYAYSLPVPQPVAAPPLAEDNQTNTPAAVPPSVVASSAYIPAPGAFAVHPALQAYTLYGNRPGESAPPFLPYPPYPQPPPQVNTHTHVERPYAQYPSPVHPLPGYLMQMQPHQSQQPISSAPPVPPMYRSYSPAMPIISPTQQQSRPTQLPVVPYAHYPSPGLPAFTGLPLSSSPQASPVQSVQTTLQLQPPSQPRAQKSVSVSPVESTDGSSKVQSGGSASGSSSLKKTPKQAAAVPAVSDSIASSPPAPAASISSSPKGGDGGNGNSHLQDAGG